MRNCFRIILTIFFCNAVNAQTTGLTKDSLQEDVEPYDYQTKLKGGYTILFKTDDELEYLYLKKGKRVITELSSVSKGMLYKNLGYAGADFNFFFVLVHSYGSGNPHSIELIKKSTGENVIEESAAWIDADEKKEILLYCKQDVPGPNDKMILYNIKTRKKELFGFPNEIFDEPQVLNRIKIAYLSENKMVIEYETEKGAKRKSYKRIQNSAAIKTN
jgi:hypothetical protein